MYSCPYRVRYSDMSRQNTSSYVRVLHASPDAPPVDIYINNNPVIRGLSYKEFSNYIPLASGSYNIKVFPSGGTTNPVINTNIFLPAKTILTVAAVGKLSRITLLPIKDESNVPVSPGKVMLRFAHLSPDTPAVDITSPTGTVLFNNVGFKQVTDYKSVDPGRYTLQARVSGTDKVVLTIPNIVLRPNRYYTVYAVGLTAGNPPLQVLIPLDGNSYLNV